MIRRVIAHQLMTTAGLTITDARKENGCADWSRVCGSAGVDAIIGRIEQAIATYPYDNSYRIWPGPNSNTFTAFVLRQVPELRVDLPAHAVGKDYLGARVFARPPSGTGAQASIFGVLGLLAAAEEGLEVNVLGLTFGLDPNDLALKLPLVGSIGFDAWDTPNAR